MTSTELTFQFVDTIPERLNSGVLYVCIPFSTAVHLCFSGCGREVVTPLSPAGWSLTFDGETVSLYPSIGNWSFPCRSHYWIRGNKVEWAAAWSDEQIRTKRRLDSELRAQHYGRGPGAKAPARSKQSTFGRLVSWFRRE